MFKINHELSKNPQERLLIIKKIINLNKLQGGNIDFSNTTHEQLNQLKTNLYTMNSRLINEDNNYGTQVIELLNNINKYIHTSDINKIILYLYKLDALLDKNILTNYKNYKTALKPIIDTLEHIDKNTSHKELLNIKKKLKLLIDAIVQDPFLKQHQHEYLQIDDQITKKYTIDVPDKTEGFLLSKTSTALKQEGDSLSTLSIQENKNKNKKEDEEDIKSLYLSETEQNLIYMLLQTIGIKNIATWDVISKKYKVLYNKIILGDMDSPDIKDNAFMYSYNDIAFVQNIINFNYFGLINWEMATLNMKKYIDDLFLVLKGNKIEEKEIIDKKHSEDNDDDVSSRESDYSEEEDSENDSEEEDEEEDEEDEEEEEDEEDEEEEEEEEDSEEEDSEEEDSENDSEEDIKKFSK